MPPNPAQETPHIIIDTQPCPTVASNPPTNTAVNHLFDGDNGGAVHLASTTSYPTYAETTATSNTAFIASSSILPAGVLPQTSSIPPLQTSTVSPSPLSTPAIIAITLVSFLILTLPVIFWVKHVLRSRQRASRGGDDDAILARGELGDKQRDVGLEMLQGDSPGSPIERGRWGRLGMKEGTKDQEKEERMAPESILETRDRRRGRDNEKALPTPPDY